MNYKKKLAGIAAGVLLVFTFSAFKAMNPDGKNKFLEGKKYEVQFYEMKTSGRGKAVPGSVVIKSGKIQCDLMEDKMNLGPATYKVITDSTYTEDDSPMHMVVFEGTYTDEKFEYKWEATVTNYDIEGTAVQMKGGVEKKKYEFSGSEKTKK
ncbi:MAG: hypothetical protein JWP12_2754 [Bacteroidetes bacterium]|nr:hypothetical protein [Bacteroidota bacterium]